MRIFFTKEPITITTTAKETVIRNKVTCELQIEVGEMLVLNNETYVNGAYKNTAIDIANIINLIEKALFAETKEEKK